MSEGFQAAAHDIVRTVQGLLLDALRRQVTPEELERMNARAFLAEYTVKETLAKLVPQPMLTEDELEAISAKIVDYGNAVAAACAAPTPYGHRQATRIHHRIVRQLSGKPFEDEDPENETPDEGGPVPGCRESHPLVLWYRVLANRVEAYTDEFAMYKSRDDFADIACNHYGNLTSMLDEVRDAEAVYLQGTPGFWLREPPVT